MKTKSKVKSKSPQQQTQDISRRSHDYNAYGEGYVRLIESWGDDASVIEAARMSTNARFKRWGDKATVGDEKLLKYLYEHNHLTPFEMIGMTVEVYAPIFVIREWMRHRTFSYNEMSARYSPLPNVNYVPTVDRLMANVSGTNKQAGTIKDAQRLTRETAEAFQTWLIVNYDTSERMYLEALQVGIPKELARVHLPVGRYSRMRVSGNLRNWFQFLKLRLHKSAQFEIRQDAESVAKIAATQFPRSMELFAASLK